MALEIPTSTELPSYVQRTTLEGREYVLAFDWNEREGRWFFDVLDSEETPLAVGLKVVVGFPLLRRKTDPRLPPGDFLAIDTSDTGADPGFAELGGRVRLCYLEAAELGT
jgi:hypothetical protein